MRRNNLKTSSNPYGWMYITNWGKKTTLITQSLYKLQLQFRVIIIILLFAAESQTGEKGKAHKTDQKQCHIQLQKD